MKQNITMHRVSAVALACALAAPSIATAQEADPATPTVVSTPVVTDPAPSAPAAETSAPAADTQEVSTTAAPVETAEPAAPVAAKTVVRPAASRANTKPASSTAKSDAAAPPVSAAEPAEPAAVDPLTTSPQAIEQVAEAPVIPTAPQDDGLPSGDGVVFGGALALLVAAAGAVGFARRRKHVDVDHDDEVAVVHDAPTRREIDLAPPTVAAAPVERSAFSWGEPTRAPTLSPVEQAMRGPTPDNPSLSLKKRLKRAHFFEQREREAARGTAVAVPRTAGLPTQVIDPARAAVSAPRRELQFA